MTQEQIHEYLKLPMIADLATVNPDGSPHVAPVWFRWDGDVVKVFTQTTAVKVRNIRNDARVSMAVSKQDAPYGYVIVNGTAKISNDGIPDEVRAMAIHYKGEEEGEIYIRQALQEMEFCLLTITPTKIIGWLDE
ncbi:MAG: PPOX class F420-dependent oxidoreductase [Chloroflexota bacterium]|nr:PPOX class F420-dependent oxidoreductase [Chloroflexota bacterium]MDE2687829.1 PPOX class F420-dependent oxidoreductase [Chloroflexota bacterium]MYC06569.1 PPOX class F420-dependent oxidoreductase [Chloroflexota bacterium]